MADWNWLRRLLDAYEPEAAVFERPVEVARVRPLWGTIFDGMMGNNGNVAAVTTAVFLSWLCPLIFDTVAATRITITGAIVAMLASGSKAVQSTGQVVVRQSSHDPSMLVLRRRGVDVLDEGAVKQLDLGSVEAALHAEVTRRHGPGPADARRAAWIRSQLESP